MLDSLLTWMTDLLQSTFLLAFIGAFLWGVLSVILSPCHLGSIPLVVGYVSQQGGKSLKDAFWTSFSFSSGILLSIGLIGVLTAFLGRMLGDIGKWGNYLVAVVFFLVGIYLLGLINLNFAGLGNLNMTRKGIWAALILGFIYGIALGPCTFAFMAPVLAITLFSSSSSFIKSFSLLSIYGIGHCLVIIFAGTFTNLIQKFLNWNEKSKGTEVIKKICGILIIISGIYILI